MNKDAKIYVAGHRGLVGGAVCRALLKKGFTNLLVKGPSLDLRDQQAVQNFFKTERPDYVFLAAAKVGGIHANNTLRGEFIYDNLMIQTNVLHAAFISDVRKLLFLGSSCIYPKHAQQPIKEEALLTAPLEVTNEPYAIAKIAGIKMCQAYRSQYGSNFICLMPTNLYGPNDNYHPMNSHVLPALIQKFYQAKSQNAEMVEIWGSGTPRREFLHVDDLANACLFLMETYNEGEVINVGTGIDISIRDLALLIKRCSGYNGELYFNTKYPDGTPQKLLDISKVKELGWSPRIVLEDGVKDVCLEYERNAELSMYFPYSKEVMLAVH